MITKPFEQYDFDDANELFGQKAITLAGRTITTGSTSRRSVTAIAASKFFSGDHWQSTDGFIGQLPPASHPGATQLTLDIKAGFVSENVIQEVLETHIGGILGREPLWSFLPSEGEPQKDNPKSFEKVTGETLTDHWNEREALKDLQKAAETVLLEGTVARRLFFPKGRLPEGGELSAPSLVDALEFIYFETLTADVAGVFTNPDTQMRIGIYIFEEKDSEGNVTANCAELSYLNEDGDTVCRIVRDRGGEDEFPPYRLGGRLLIDEIQRRPLITEQVQSNQKALNLAHTMMMRNVNLAGSRERIIANAQPPTRIRRVADPNNPSLVREISEVGTFEVGAGVVNNIVGWPIHDADGNIVGYTNPNVSITDPAPVETFKQTRDHYYAAILGQCHQRHKLISGDAVASGKSRKQAEKDYQRSLKETKTVLDASGRWQLETTLRLAAQLIGQSEKYLALRADFNCLFDIGEPDPDDRRIVMEMRKPGGPNNQPLISDETARNWAGIDDAEAELVKIEAEAPTDEEIAARQALMQPPVNGDAEVVN